MNTPITIKADPNPPAVTIGYHFTADVLRDGRPIPAVGAWLEQDGPIIPCRLGLHASEHPLDALEYAPGTRLHRVELDGDLQSHGNPVDNGNPVDKWVGRRRKILASIDAESLLREFARWCAMQVIELWDAPLIVREYLETGNESLRDAARYAAGYAARAAGAAGDAAWAAREAARTAMDAARAARYAAGYAAGAARDAARTAQRDKLLEMVEDAFQKQETRELLVGS